MEPGWKSGTRPTITGSELAYLSPLAGRGRSRSAALFTSPRRGEVGWHRRCHPGEGLFARIRTRGERPSPAAHLAMRVDLSPSGRGEGRRLMSGTLEVTALRKQFAIGRPAVDGV